MKDKIKELKNFSDEELLAEIARRSGSREGIPIKAKCFQCKEDLWIKWNRTTQAHSKKNDYEYWNGESTSEKICNVCLKALYYNKPVFWNTVRDLKKRKILSGYVSNILG